MAVAEIETRLIAVRPDARKVDDATVRGLMNSIAELGIMNPLRVRPARRFIDGVEADAYEVTAGRHRLTAARKLGLASVPCIIVDDDDLHAELAMIDENLCRAELSPADRAANTARRKAIYLELHPETAQHVAGAHAANAAMGNASANFAPAFTAATAAVTGRSERAVQLDAERGEKIDADALALVVGTALNTGTFLDRLKQIEGRDAQIEAVHKALAGVARQAERDRAAAVEQRNASRIEADIKRRAAKVFAEALAEKFTADEWDFVKAQLASATSKDILAEFLNITGASVRESEAA